MRHTIYIDFFRLFLLFIYEKKIKHTFLFHKLCFQNINDCLDAQNVILTTIMQQKLKKAENAPDMRSLILSVARCADEKNIFSHIKLGETHLARI